MAEDGERQAQAKQFGRTQLRDD